MGSYRSYDSRKSNKIMANTARSDTPFRKEPAPNLPSSVFDHSYDHKLTFQMGQLIPFACLETHPGDRWSLSMEFFARYAPTYFPLIQRINFEAWYFFIPNSLTWETGWRRFIAEQDKVLHPTKLHPYFTLKESDNTIGAPLIHTLAEYLGFPSPLTSDTVHVDFEIKINAFPIAAYHRIFHDYFLNTRVLDYIEIELGDGGNDGQAWYSNSIRRRMWNYDNFTAATLLPQSGADVLIPMSNFQSVLIDGDIPPLDIEGTVKGPYQWLKLTTDATTTGDLTQSVGHNYGGSGTFIGANQMYLDIQTNAATIRQLRLHESVQGYLEKFNRTGDKYSDVMIGFFGTDPTQGQIDYAVYIGSVTGVVQVSDVMAHTEISDTSPLGAYAGKLESMQGSPVFNYSCLEHGFIIGILNVQPTTSYTTGAERFWFRNDKWDYAWPDFAGIGDQQIFNQELAIDYNVSYDGTGEDKGTNLDTWGYIPRYTEFRYKNSRISGEFRNEWTSWHMARAFDGGNLVALGINFLQCTPNTSDNFQGTYIAPATHEIFAHVWNKCVVRRNLPQYGVPTS